MAVSGSSSTAGRPQLGMAQLVNTHAVPPLCWGCCGSLDGHSSFTVVPTPVRRTNAKRCNGCVLKARASRYGWYTASLAHAIVASAASSLSVCSGRPTEMRMKLFSSLVLRGGCGGAASGSSVSSKQRGTVERLATHVVSGHSTTLSVFFWANKTPPHEPALGQQWQQQAKSAPVVADHDAVLLGEGVLEAARVPPVGHLAQHEVGVGGEGLRGGEGLGAGKGAEHRSGRCVDTLLQLVCWFR